jgi:hypothetical protein
VSEIAGTRITAEQARTLTDRAKDRLTAASEIALAAVEDITAVIESGGHAALGYDSPAAYLLAEFDVSAVRLDPAGRRELALTLVRNGVSRRAAARALGVSEGTVRNDVSGAQDYAPDRVLGADGKTYLVVRPEIDAPQASYRRWLAEARTLLAGFGLPDDEELVRECAEVVPIREAARALLRFGEQVLPPDDWRPAWQKPKHSGRPVREARYRLTEERNRLAYWEVLVMCEAGDFLNWCEGAGIEVGRGRIVLPERLRYPLDPGILPDDWTAEDEHRAALGHFYVWWCTPDDLRVMAGEAS